MHVHLCSGIWWLCALWSFHVLETCVGNPGTKGELCLSANHPQQWYFDLNDGNYLLLSGFHSPNPVGRIHTMPSIFAFICSKHAYLAWCTWCTWCAQPWGFWSPQHVQGVLDARARAVLSLAVRKVWAGHGTSLELWTAGNGNRFESMVCYERDQVLQVLA